MPEFVFALPDLGEGLVRAEVSSWKVSVGDKVTVNQPLVEVHTDKALVEIPSPVEGTITTLHSEEGTEVAVGAPLVTFETERKAVLVGYGVDQHAKTVGSVGLAPPPPRKRAEKRAGVASVESDTQPTAPDETPRDQTTIPVRGIRRTIAKRMAESWASIPHVTTYLTVNATQLEVGRKALSVSPLAVIVKAWATIVKARPALNARFDNDRIVLHQQCNIGIAADTPDGLVVPVIFNADTMSPKEIAQRISELANQARASSIKIADLKGATTTISNVGVFGAEYGTPIINPGESSILATGVIEPRAVVVAGEVVVRDCMTLSLSFDHRVIDGASAGTALAELREILEDAEALKQL